MTAPTRLCVLAPTPLLTVTIESGSRSDEPEIHIHPGGQGLWIARMARSLDAAVTVCGPFGGEAGVVAAYLAEREGLTVRAVPTAGGSGAYLHDRRHGERRELAATEPRPLDRHELDDLYGTVLVEALAAGVCVLTGADPATLLPDGFLGRLTADLRAADVVVVADASGSAATALAAAGVDVLKMSDEEMCDAELAAGDDVAELHRAAVALCSADEQFRGARAMMVSRADQPALLVTRDALFEVQTPTVTAVDHRGAGDSMTAGIAVGVGRGIELTEAVRLGAAAGALNVTRRGLGTGRREQIERLAEHVSIRRIDPEGGTGTAA